MLSGSVIGLKDGSSARHPGAILFETVMRPLGISRNRLARAIDVPVGRISDIVSGKRSITPDTALRLAKFFGTSPELWMRLQTEYDLNVARRDAWPKINSRVETFSQPSTNTGSGPSTKIKQSHTAVTTDHDPTEETVLAVSVRPRQFRQPVDTIPPVNRNIEHRLALAMLRPKNDMVSLKSVQPLLQSEDDDDLSLADNADSLDIPDPNDPSFR